MAPNIGRRFLPGRRRLPGKPGHHDLCEQCLPAGRSAHANGERTASPRSPWAESGTAPISPARRTCARKRSTASGTIGFKATIASDGFFNGWNVDGYYQYGKTDVDAAQEGGIRVDRIWLALDAVVDPATGNIVCNASLAPNSAYRDCKPLNLFGRGRASQEAIDWVTGFDPGVAVTTTPYLPGYPPETYSYVGDEFKHRLIEIRQDVAEVSASGKVADGWAGPISAAMGAHYRKESLDQKVQASQGNPSADPLNFNVVPANNPALNIRGVPGGARNNSVEFQFSKVPFARGEYDIKEVFTEALVPLYGGARWLKQLNFNGAARWADYGGSGTIWTYKGGLDANFTDSFRLRGTYSRDVRAANLGERFDRTGGAGSVRDPRKPTTAPNVPVTLVQGGNPEVLPEKADTYTVGFVYRPGWLPGVRCLRRLAERQCRWIDRAVRRAGHRQRLLHPERPGSVPRTSRWTPRASSTSSTRPTRTCRRRRSAASTWRWATRGPSRSSAAASGSASGSSRAILDENSTTNSTGVKTDRAGQVGTGQATLFALPEWKATASLNYSRGPFRSFVQLRYIGDGIYDTQNGIGPNNWIVADNEIGSIVVRGREALLGHELRRQRCRAVRKRHEPVRSRSAAHSVVQRSCRRACAVSTRGCTTCSGDASLSA